MPMQQQGVIERFTNEGGAGWLSDRGSEGHLTYTGGIVAGKAEGRGTIRMGGGYDCTLRDAEFRGGRLLPCVAVFAWDDGDAYAGPVSAATCDAYAGPLTASGEPADGARGAVVRGRDGGRFQGTWPANGEDNEWFFPLRGVAWVAADGSLHAVAFDGRFGEDENDDICSGGPGWRPGGAGWVRIGVLTRSDGQAAFAGTDPLWWKEEAELLCVLDDGRRLEGAFRGLCPQRGVLTDADGRRWRVVYSGDAPLAADLEPVTREEEDSLESALAALALDAAAAAALLLLRAEQVTAGQLRDGTVTDADLEGAGLAPDARAAIAAWRRCGTRPRA